MLIKMLKTAMGVGVLAFGAREAAKYTLLDTSNQAAIVAQSTLLRAPIAGNVAEASGIPGQAFEAKAPILELQTRTPPEAHLRELSTQLAKVKAEIQGLDEVRPQLERIGVLLRSSTGTYNLQRVKQLEAELASADAAIRVAQARYEASSAKLQRVESLKGEGLETADAVEQARRDSEVNAQEMSAAKAAESASLGSLQAAKHGVQVGSFGADKATSAQRLDEVAMRLAELRTQYNVKRVEAENLERQVALERREADVRGRAVVTAPVRGRLWQSYVARNDFVSEGTPLLRLAACEPAMVGASVSEQAYNRIRIGQQVGFRLAASGETVDGVVAQTFGVLQPTAPTSFDWGLLPAVDAAFGVSATRGAQGLVLVRLRRWPAGVDCQVGLTGEVLFRAVPFTRWLW